MTGRLIKHNPAFLTEEELRDSFVVREAERDAVLEIVRENRGGTNQHILVIAARGMGKTMLVHRAALAVRDDEELSKRWLPIVIAEEKYDVASAGELWLEVLGQAARSPLADGRRWAEAYERLRTITDAKSLHDQALARLRELADEEGLRLLVVAENLNMIFDEQAQGEMGWDLRDTLLNEPRIMLLATATVRFDEVKDTANALFDLFREIVLEPLSTAECVTLWRRVTGKEMSEQRIRPMEILTGGNPRLLAVLATFSAGRSFRELMADLIELVDDHTTYFKANVEVLPPLERRVFVTLADIWDPAGAREVSRRARMDVNKASVFLKRLVGRGVVTEVDRKGRKIFYQITERLYNIYHLMRQRSTPSERARAVIEFMARYYECDEIVQTTEEMRDRTATQFRARLEKLVPILENLIELIEKTETADNNVIECLIQLAAFGSYPVMLKHLETSDVAMSVVEPVVVALRLECGEEVRTAHEIAEVASDIRDRIHAQRREMFEVDRPSCP